MLVADLADADARDILESAALARGRVCIPLETAPISAAKHVLEVHTPGAAEPSHYIAEPLGPPTADGFPLRLSPMPGSDAAVPASTPDGRARPQQVLRGKRSQSSMALSESHTKDLSVVGPLPTGEGEDSTIGRALAGGKLLIEQRIGRGGVGSVYKARHRELMMPVAVKVLHESFQNDIEFCRRFYAEALAASRLDHPNITRVIDFGQEPDGQLYLAMEFLDGVELRSVLERERKLPPHRIASVMMQVCAALSQAHARGIVHRDIKPENLVLVPGHDDDGTPIEIVKVCDFGIALQRSLATDTDGFVAGTPEYMSPEQCRSDELDARSDVYACGVVLYELATGQVPFTGGKPIQILNKHQFTPVLPPSKLDPKVSPLLEGIVMKALAKNPDERHASMRELRAELRQLLHPAHPPASAPRVAVAGAEVEAARPRRPPPPLPEPRSAGAPSPRASPAAPAWLERGPVYSAQTGAAAATAASPASIDADALSDNPARWAQGLAQINDPAAFAQATHKLDPALRVLAARGDVNALWSVSSTLHGIAMEGSGATGSRAWTASKLLRVFEDPAILLQVAEQLLGGPREARDRARRLLVHAGVAGAYGLYGARVKLARAPDVRPQFIAVTKDFGPRAWPVVRASLEKIAATPEPNAATLELAEDLLLCVPFVGDESAGHLVMKFCRSRHSPVCRAAAAALIKLWGVRAKPVFVAMVQSNEDVVRVAGIAGLRQLKAIDEHLVPRLGGILTGAVPASDEVRAAAAVALGHASDTAKPPAISLLAQGLSRANSGPPGSRAHAAAPKHDAVILAIARSLIAIGGAASRPLVEGRAEQSLEPLRSQLRALLGAG